MGRRPSVTLTTVELEFMQVLWEGDELTTEDIQRSLNKRGRPLSDGSVRKMLAILIDKGYAARERCGRGFRYRATVGEDQAHRRLVRDLLKRAFGGSAALLVATLMDSGTVKKRDLEKIKRLIAERERAS